MLNSSRGKLDKKLTVSNIVSMMDGSYNYDILLLAHLEAINGQLLAQEYEREFPLITVASGSK